jgi:hypothetical protein
MPWNCILYGFVAFVSQLTVDLLVQPHYVGSTQLYTSIAWRECCDLMIDIHSQLNGTLQILNIVRLNNDRWMPNRFRKVDELGPPEDEQMQSTNCDPKGMRQASSSTQKHKHDVDRQIS